MIFSLVYVSTASRPLSRTDLVELLVDCRSRNSEAGLTGILLYREARILQLLEGQEGVVRRVYERIAADPRHRDISTVWVSLGAHRQFADWTMGFRDLDEEPVGHPGFSDVLHPDSGGLTGRPEHVRELLALVARAA